MKITILTIAVIILTVLRSSAQFKLSGRIQNFKGADSVVVNIPFVYGNYGANDIKIPVDGSGKFKFTVPVNTQKFINFSYKNSYTSLLLRPGKSLSIVIDTAGKVLDMTGNAALSR